MITATAAIDQPAHDMPAREAAPTWREVLIDRIVELNPSADHEFLGGFEEPALEQYASHLESALTPRGRGSRWSRPNDSPAVMAWQAPKETLDRLW